MFLCILIMKEMFQGKYINVVPQHSDLCHLDTIYVEGWYTVITQKYTYHDEGDSSYYSQGVKEVPFQGEPSSKELSRCGYIMDVMHIRI